MSIAWNLKKAVGYLDGAAGSTEDESTKAMIRIIRKNVERLMASDAVTKAPPTMSDRVATIRDAASGHMPTRQADELARNIVMGLAQCDYQGEHETAKLNYVFKAIQHRKREFALFCADPYQAANDIIRAWKAVA